MALLRIGLTGGIASGKSTVSKLFAEREITIIDADQIARDQLSAGSPLLKDIQQRFGGNIFSPEGVLDRKALGRIVFKSPSDLEWLNQLIHPKVAQEINQRLLKTSSPYVILDIPLLINQSGEIPTHLRQLIDRVLVVDVPQSLQLSRLHQRDQIDEQHAKEIIANQSSREQKLKLADDIIDNAGSLENLESQVALLHNQYLNMSRAGSASD